MEKAKIAGLRGLNREKNNQPGLFKLDEQTLEEELDDIIIKD